jgi:hypothetical protein
MEREREDRDLRLRLALFDVGLCIVCIVCWLKKFLSSKKLARLFWRTDVDWGIDCSAGPLGLRQAEPAAPSRQFV